MTTVTVLFSADITADCANNFASYLGVLATNGTTQLTVGLNSSGGSVVAGVFLYNTLRAMPFDIVMHNVGNVDSIANIIFLAGGVRKACPGTTFMFHGVGFESNPAERLEEKNLKEKLDVVTSDHARLAQIIASRTTLTQKNCRTLFAQQSTRGAQWAKDKGMISDIADFIYPPNGQFHTFFG